MQLIMCQHKSTYQFFHYLEAIYFILESIGIQIHRANLNELRFEKEKG